VPKHGRSLAYRPMAKSLLANCYLGDLRPVQAICFETIDRKPYIHITTYPYSMRIDIILPEDLVLKTRLASIEKYGNSRSMSKLIEEFIIKGLESIDKPPEACSILGARSELSLRSEKEFNDTVSIMSEQIHNLKIESSLGMRSPYNIFELKEAFEMRINRLADMINGCLTCHGIQSPVPKYETAGKNFELWALACNDVR
jgi:hypothetical protein